MVAQLSVAPVGGGDADDGHPVEGVAGLQLVHGREQLLAGEVARRPEEHERVGPLHVGCGRHDGSILPSPRTTASAAPASAGLRSTASVE